MSSHSGDAAHPQFSLLLPAYNEEELLEATVRFLIDGMDERQASYEVVVAENGSTDSTRSIAERLAGEFDVVETLSLPVGDYGAALLAGFERARGEVVVSFDVDYYDLAFFDAATDIVLNDGADIVVASKRAAGAQDRRPLVRRMLTFGFTTLLRWMVALPVSDAHGMKALRRATVAPLAAQCQLRGSLYDVELVCRAGRAGLTIRELPANVEEMRPVRTGVGKRAIEATIATYRLRRILRADRHSKSRG